MITGEGEEAEGAIQQKSGDLIIFDNIGLNWTTTVGVETKANEVKCAKDGVF